MGENGEGVPDRCDDAGGGGGSVNDNGTFGRKGMVCLEDGSVGSVDDRLIEGACGMGRLVFEDGRNGVRWPPPGTTKDAVLATDNGNGLAVLEVGAPKCGGSAEMTLCGSAATGEFTGLSSKAPKSSPSSV